MVLDLTTNDINFGSDPSAAKLIVAIVEESLWSVRRVWPWRLRPKNFYREVYKKLRGNRQIVIFRRNRHVSIGGRCVFMFMQVQEGRSLAREQTTIVSNFMPPPSCSPCR